MHRTSFLVTATLATLAATSAIGAQIGEATTPDGGVFAGACAGTFLSGPPNPGVSAANFFGSTMTCQTNSSTPGGSTSATAASSGTINGNPYANTATATVAPGVLRLGADENGSSGTAFSAAIAEAGLNDRVTLGGGTGSGYWVLPVYVQGMMTASGPTALGTFQIGLYKNHSLVSLFNGGNAYALFAGMNSHNYGNGRENTELEMMTYEVRGNGVSSLAIANTSYFIIPVTFGVSFEFALYANAAAREGSNAGQSFGQSQTSVDFGHTISYAGGAYFLGNDNSTITNLTYTSAAGFDYQNAAIPEPATWLLGSLSLLVTFRYRYKLRRQ